jgi:hypothetical protein
MTIVDARVKVCFTKEEDRALREVADMLKTLKVKNSTGFLTAYLDKDWSYCDDDGNFFEFPDNQNYTFEDD